VRVSSPKFFHIPIPVCQCRKLTYVHDSIILMYIYVYIVLIINKDLVISKKFSKMNFCFKVFFWALLFVILDIFFTEVIFPFAYCFFLFVVPDGASLEESKSRSMSFDKF